MKKNIEINIYDEKSRSDFFKKFIIALSKNTVSIKNSNIIIQENDITYSVNLSKFLIVWEPSFRYIYEVEFPKIIFDAPINKHIVNSLYAWTNPIFDEFPIDIPERKKFFDDLKNKIENDKIYHETIKQYIYQIIDKLDFNDLRRDYINRYISLGILEKTDKIPLQYYADYSPTQLSRIFEEENMSRESKIEIISQAFTIERAKQMQNVKKRKRPYNIKIVKLVDLLDIEEIVDGFMSGVLENEEFFKTKVTKSDLLNLPCNTLLNLLSSKNNLLPERLKITSKDLVNAYGRSLNGSEIYKLVNDGYIDDNDLIEIYEINKVLKKVEYEEKIFEDEKIKEFYTPAKILDMKSKNQLSPKFLELYLELMDFENNPKIFEERSKILIEELEKRIDDKDDRVDNELYFFDIVLCDVETAKTKISEENIENRFVYNKISIEKVFEYYKRGLIGQDTLIKYFSKDELLELYDKGEVDFNALTIIDDNDLLIEKFVESQISDNDFLSLYLYGKLTIEDFKDGVELSERESNISGFIDEKVSFENIKELFINYLIDYSTILDLHENKIIDDKQFEEIKNSISVREFFNEIDKRKTYVMVTSRNNLSSSKSVVNSRNSAKKKDFSQEIELISRLLDKDVENEPFSLIKSHNENGKATSLNEYRIFGNKDLDGIVILQKSKKQNAVFVMNALQMIYFLNGRESANGTIQNRMKDKAFLRTISGIEVVEHTEHFARNLIEAVCRVSPTVAENVKDNDSEYVKDVAVMVENMRRRYLEEKGRI